ncbi:MAG: sugar transferase [Deltaproteobacteria bacterium]|nr:sugar transferase [Deltaproteobacteria bacterium]
MQRMADTPVSAAAVRRPTLRYQTTLLVLMFADILCVLLMYLITFVLRIYVSFPFTVDLLPSIRFSEVNHPLFILATSQIILLYFFGFYDLHALVHRTRLVTNVAAALGVQLLATSAWYFFRGDLLFPRSVLVLLWLLNTVGVTVLRLWVVRWLARVRPLRVLLVGAAEELVTFLSGLPEVFHTPGLNLVGLVAVDHPMTATAHSSVPWLGKVEDLPQLMREYHIEEVILLSQPTWKDSFIDSLVRSSDGWREYEDRPRVLVVPSVYDILVGRVSTLRLHDVPLVEVLKDPQEDLAFLVKEIVDVGIAAVLLLLSLPVLCIAICCIKFTSSGPTLYRQRRVGRDGQEFVMYKLRTMVDGAEVATGPILAGVGDERITRVGRFLRATRIDEIPQLFNVLNGTMSLVGPRPERPEFVEEFLRTIPGYAERLLVKPGLTGLAQVNGEYHTTAEYKLKYDLAYIYNYSLWLDMRIMAETVKVMLTRRGV